MFCRYVVVYWKNELKSVWSVQNAVKNIVILCNYDLSCFQKKKNPAGDEIFLPSIPALGPTQSPVKWVPGLSPGVKCGRGVTLTPHPLLVPWSRKSIAIPLLPQWAVRPVPRLSACRRVYFTYYLYWYDLRGRRWWKQVTARVNGVTSI